MNIIFLGAPGAGKGTQADFVSRSLCIPTISTGAMIREAIKNGTEMGKSAKEYIEAGKLVPDNVVNGIVGERLRLADCANGFILDGFPRTLPQAQALEDMGIAIDLALDLEVPDGEIVTRMSGRRVCPKCGATYHTKHNPSKDGGKCDNCGETLSVRKDDDPAVVLDRLKIYHEQTEPLIEFYKNKGTLRVIPGIGTIDEITASVEKAIQTKTKASKADKR